MTNEGSIYLSFLAVPKSSSGSFEQNFDGIPPAINRERSSVFDWTQEQVRLCLHSHFF